MLKTKTLIHRFVIGFSLLGVCSCDILEEDLFNSFSEDPFPLPSQWTIGIPFLNGDLSMNDLVDIEDTENLITLSDSTYALTLTDSQTLGTIQDFSEAMGIENDANGETTLFQIQPFDLGSGITQSNGILELIPDGQSIPDIEIYFTNDESETFNEDLINLKLYVPVSLSLPNAEGSSELPNMNFSNISFSQGKLQIRLETDAPNAIFINFENLYNNNTETSETISFTRLSPIGNIVTFELDLTDYAIDLWDETANNNVGAPPSSAPTILITANEAYTVEEVTITDDNEAESISLIFNEETTIQGDDIQDEEIDVDLENELFENGSLEFNPENEAISTALTFQNRLGFNFTITPRLTASYNNGETTTITFTDINGVNIPDQGVTIDKNTASTTIKLSDAATLFSVTPEKRLEHLVYGGALHFNFELNEQITLTKDIHLISSFDVNLPLDVRVNGLEFDIDSEEGIDDIGYDIGEESSGVLTLQTNNEMPFDIGIKIIMQTNNGMISIPSQADQEDYITIGSGFTESITTHISYEQIQALTDNRSLMIQIRASSEEFGVLKASDVLHIKAGILATLDLENTDFN